MAIGGRPLEVWRWAGRTSSRKAGRLFFRFLRGGSAVIGERLELLSDVEARQDIIILTLRTDDVCHPTWRPRYWMWRSQPYGLGTDFSEHGSYHV